MASARARRSAFAFHCSLSLACAGAILAGCGGAGGESAGTGPDESDPVRLEPGTHEGNLLVPDAIAQCHPGVDVKSGGNALLVRDPAVLSHFTLERVLDQLIATSGAGGITPEQLLQRMFDTENTEAAGVFPDNVHCDSPFNGAFKNGAPVDCPRAEGELATSHGLLTPGDADYFAPVALVNRIDLMPSSLETCGEYRIVFAKQSGKTDPADRVFLILEGVIFNPSFNILGCRPVAQAWLSLQDEADPQVLADRLEEIYFTGLPGFDPVVHHDHYGNLSTEDDPYGASRGQIRLSQRMQDSWEMREMRLVTAVSWPGNSLGLNFAPATVKNSPMASLFDLSVQTDVANGFRGTFLNFDLPSLGRPDFKDIRMQTSNQFNAGESALSGLASADYATPAGAGGGELMDQIADMIDAYQLNVACPPEDPLKPEDILSRASALSCAGCHAPEGVTGAERRIGCGLSWPATLGGAHIDERGEISPALTGTFLPHRAEVMETYLEGCDMQAIWENLQPVPSGAIPD